MLRVMYTAFLQCLPLLTQVFELSTLSSLLAGKGSRMLMLGHVTPVLCQLKTWSWLLCEPFGPSATNAM